MHAASRSCNVGSTVIPSRKQGCEAVPLGQDAGVKTAVRAVAWADTRHPTQIVELPTPGIPHGLLSCVSLPCQAQAPQAVAEPLEQHMGASRMPSHIATSDALCSRQRPSAVHQPCLQAGQAWRCRPCTVAPRQPQLSASTHPTFSVFLTPLSGRSHLSLRYLVPSLVVCRQCMQWQMPWSGTR